MYRIGIDLGGTNLVAGLVDESRKILDLCAVKTQAPRPVEALIADMATLVKALIQRNGLTRADIAAVGVGVPCTANQENGHMEDANNLGYTDTPFLVPLGQALGLPVRFGNDANVAAWGEYLAGDYPEDSFVMVTIGTGIGGGIILNGRLWEGINGAAAEFGHMSVNRDVACNCGRRGCFEACASAAALVRQAQDAMAQDRTTRLWALCGGDPEMVEAKTVFEAAAAGDVLAQALLEAYLDTLADGITSIINIFQPAVLCIGGGISRAGDALLLPLREKVARQIYSKNAEKNTQIVGARLYNEAGILGAALL